MEFEYSNRIQEIMENAEKINSEAIKVLANKIKEVTENHGMIHCFGTGHSHMLGVELSTRAGGLANVNAMLDPDASTTFGAERSGKIERLSGLADIIYENYDINPKTDMMIITSNSGRNGVPIEMAMRCKKEGLYCVSVTNVDQSKNQTSRHPSGKRLFELTDLVINSSLPVGDAVLNVGGYGCGAASSIVTMFLLNIAVTEAVKLMVKDEKEVPILISQNVDGHTTSDLAKSFYSRIKNR